MAFNLASLKVSLLEDMRQKIPFFRDFGLEDLKGVLKGCQQARFPSGARIIKEGEVGDRMYIVIQGQVQVSRSKGSKEEVLCVLGPGECVGEMGMVERSRRSATVKAASDCLLLAVSPAILDRVNPSFSSRLYRNIASILAERLRRTSNLVEETQTERNRLRSYRDALEEENQELKSTLEELMGELEKVGGRAHPARYRVQARSKGNR